MVKRFRLYHLTATVNAAQILAGTFRDDEGKDASGQLWRGVWLSDKLPSITAPSGDALLSVDLPLSPDELQSFGRDEKAGSFQAFVIPAALLNRRAVVFLTDEEIDFESLPFYRGEAQAVWDCLREILGRSGTPPEQFESLIAGSWPKIVDSAGNLQSRSALDRPGPRKLRLRQKLNRLRARSASTLPIDLEVLIPLAEAAKALGMLSQRYQPPLHDPTQIWKKLARLTTPQLQICISRVLKNKIVFTNRGGRPRQAALDSYVADLCVIYEETTGKPLTNSRDANTGVATGPGLRFIRTCLAPFERDDSKSLTDEGLVHLLRRLKRARLAN